PNGVLQWLEAGPLDPLHLFGIGEAPPLVHGVAISLGVNLLLYGLVSARNSPKSPLPRLLRSDRQVTDLGGLVQLTASFVGAERAAQEFPEAQPGRPVDRRAARRAQKLIAGVVGASSARALVASALAGGQMSLGDVTRLLDERGQSLRFSRSLLAATLENIEAGISVIDADLNLQAWNSRYEDLFAYPPGLIRVGVPVADLIRHNAKAGDFGPGDVEYHVAKRLEHMRRGQPHSFERRRRDGRVFKTVGGPMPGGGYVMSFSDITDEARVRSELERTLAELESRVAERTRELSEANQRLARATQDKTRFLAAASHDLLQPLHAARLFTAALERDKSLASPEPVKRIERAIVAAEDLLRALLDISKLDAGGVQPKPEAFALAPFLRDIVEVVRPLAAAKGLELRVGTLAGTVCTDPALLRSVVQNFLVNAVRYTPEGGVLVGVRQRRGELRIDVIDTGVGIPEGQREAIFAEFTRVGEVEAEGLGLGLAIADRIVRLLGGRIELASRVGRGSRFSVALPRHEGAVPRAPAAPARGVASGPLTVLVVDNDPTIVAATSALLEAMGHAPRGAATVAEGLARAPGVDLVLADYRLDRGESGLDLVSALKRQRPGLACAMITAEADAALAGQAAALGVPVLAKPLAPETLEALLASVSVRQVEP
ncbi:MAG: PAS-domain containing protein, partial [Sphingomonadales bacterium]|nr:PAS-domain containing protein [Sphingomonadales bacterium]